MAAMSLPRPNLLLPLPLPLPPPRCGPGGTRRVGRPAPASSPPRGATEMTNRLTAAALLPPWPPAMLALPRPWPRPRNRDAGAGALSSRARSKMLGVLNNKGLSKSAKGRRLPPLINERIDVPRA